MQQGTIHGNIKFEDSPPYALPIAQNVTARAEGAVLEMTLDVITQLVFGRLLDWQLCRFRALEDAARDAFQIYSLIVCTTLEVGRVSVIGPFNCFRMASS